MNNKNSIVRRLYEYFNKHWFLSFIISSIPAIITTLITLFPERYQEAVNSCPFLEIVLLILLSISAVFTLSKLYFSTKESFADRGRLSVYKTLIQSIISFENQNTQELKKLIFQNRYKSSLTYSGKEPSPFLNATSRLHPVHKIEIFLKKVIEVLSTVFGIDQNNISVSLIYKPKEKDSWSVISELNIYDDEISLDELMKNPQSSYMQVLSQKGGSLLYIDKKEAISAQKYVPSDHEQDNQICGSIYCKNLSIYDNDKISVGFVLAIATRGMQFGNDDEYSKNLCLEIFRFIESVIQNELCSFCMNKHLGLSKNISNLTTRQKNNNNDLPEPQSAVSKDNQIVKSSKVYKIIKKFQKLFKKSK